MALSSICKALNSINIIKIMYERNQFNIKDKELGYAVSSLVNSLYGTFAAIMNITIFLL